MLPVAEHILVRRLWRELSCKLGREQFVLLRRTKCRKEIIKVERIPRLAILTEERMFQLAALRCSQQGRLRHRIAHRATHKRRYHAAINTVHGGVLQSD